MKNSLTQLIFCLLMLLTSVSYGQKKGKTPKQVDYEVKLKDGTSYIGKMISTDKNNMLFLTNSGDTITVSKQNIKSFELK